MSDRDHFPPFRFHPDPLETGSVKPSDAPCTVCDRTRGFIYDGPIRDGDLPADVAICSWCFADGTAHAHLAIAFTDVDGIGDAWQQPWDSIPPEALAKIAFRTRGFIGWQQQRWWTHCHDGAAFLGLARTEDLDGRWRDAVEVMRIDRGYAADDSAWAELVASFDRYTSATAYVSRCLHCQKLDGYWDCD